MSHRSRPFAAGGIAAVAAFACAVAGAGARARADTTPGGGAGAAPSVPAAPSAPAASGAPPAVRPDEPNVRPHPHGPLPHDEEVPGADAPAEDRGPGTGRIWAEAGPCWIASSANYVGVRAAIGADAAVDESRRWRLGGFLMRTFSDEAIGGDFAGSIRRTSLIASVAFQIVPDRVWVRLGGGLSLISSANENFGAKLKPVSTFAAGYQVPLSTHARLGFKLSWERTGEARRSIYSAVNSLSCSFGACESTGVAPQANVYAFSVMYIFSP